MLWFMKNVWTFLQKGPQVPDFLTQRNFGPQKFWAPKNVMFKKIFSQKIFLVHTTCGCKKIGSQKIWFWKNGRDGFLAQRESRIANISLLQCLEPFEKFVMVVVWSRPLLGVSFSQAEQQDSIQECSALKNFWFHYYYYHYFHYHYFAREGLKKKRII